MRLSPAGTEKASSKADGEEKEVELGKGGGGEGGGDAAQGDALHARGKGGEVFRRALETACSRSQRVVRQLEGAIDSRGRST